MKKKTICFDFDGVIHLYTSGWKGADIIPDGPVPGIKEAIDELSKDYNIVVVSARAANPKGREAIKKWLALHDIKVNSVSGFKVPADYYVDDKAVAFNGNPTDLIKSIKKFTPWHEDPKVKKQVLSFK